MKTSGMFKLNWQDAAKGLLMAILAPVLVLLQQSIDAGALTLNWKLLGMAAVGGGVGYLIKNFFTPTQITDNTNPPKTK